MMFDVVFSQDLHDTSIKTKIFNHTGAIGKNCPQQMPPNDIMCVYIKVTQSMSDHDKTHIRRTIR